MANRLEPYAWGRLDFLAVDSLPHASAEQLLDILTLDRGMLPLALETRIGYGKPPTSLIAVRESRYGDFARVAHHSIPGLTIQRLSDTARGLTRPTIPEGHAYQLTLSRRYFSIAQDQTLDFTRDLTTTLYAALEDGEEVVFHTALGGVYYAEREYETLIDPRYNNPLLRALGLAPVAEDDVAEAVEDRYQHHGFLAQIRIGIVAEAERLETLKRIISACLSKLDTKHTRLKLGRHPIPVSSITHATNPKTKNSCLNLCPAEVLPFLFWPIDKLRVPYSTAQHPKQLLPPYGFGCRESQALGATTHGDSTTYLAIPEDNLTRHILIDGKSGGGKSTLATNHALNLINAGESILIIDPKGDFRRRVWGGLGPATVDRAKLIDLNLSDPEYALSFNPFEPIWRSGASREAVSDNITAAIEKSSGGWWGATMTDVLSCAIKTLAYYVNRPTIPMLVPLLLEPDFRRPITERAILEDPYGLGAFWKNYEAVGKVGQAKMTESSMRRLREFTTRESLRTILGVPNPKFDFSELFELGKQVVVILTGNAGASGQQVASLINSLAVSQFWSSTQAQSIVPEGERKRVHLMVDEAGDNINLSMPLSEMCAQARGYNVCLTLICQYKNQLGDNLDSAENNIATHISFGSNSASGCKALAEQFGSPLTPQDFQELPLHHFYMRTDVGDRQETMLGRTMPHRQTLRSYQTIAEMSRAAYGTRKSEAAGAGYTEERQKQAAEVLATLSSEEAEHEE